MRQITVAAIDRRCADSSTSSGGPFQTPPHRFSEGGGGGGAVVPPPPPPASAGRRRRSAEERRSRRSTPTPSSDTGELGEMPTRMGEQAATPTVKRKNASLGFFSNIFKRRRDETDPAHVVHTAGDVPLSPPTSRDDPAGSRDDPAGSRDDLAGSRDASDLQTMANIEEDLQKLQMSRQDNPFLQRLQSSGEDLVAAEDETDDARLVVTESGNGRQLALAEIHSHLVRSPPPIPWPRGSQRFNFDDLHESEVVPRSNLRPLAAKDRGQVMDQCLQDILQTQRSIPLQKASVVDETFTGRLSPRTSPLRAPPTVRHLSPRRGRTPPERPLLESAGPSGAAAAATTSGSEGRLDTPLAPVRVPARGIGSSHETRPKLSLQISCTNFPKSPEKSSVQRPNT